MIPKQTKFTNVIVGEGQAHVQPCPAHVAQNGDVIITMDLTDEEVEAIVKNKEIFLRLCTGGQPMQPFTMWATDKNGKYVRDERAEPKDNVKAEAVTKVEPKAKKKK